MANRAYLYSVDRLPSGQVNREDLRIEAVAEFAYDLPLAYLILVSGNPQRVPSLVWDGVEAVAGNFDEGLERLLEFLESIPHPAIKSWKEQTHTFLIQERFKQQFFLLEVDEILWMGGEEWDPDDPIQDIVDYASGIEPVLIANRRRLEGDNSAISADEIEKTRDLWGLSSFSDVLYYDLGSITGEKSSKPASVRSASGLALILGFGIGLPLLLVLSVVFISPWLFPIAILAFVAFLHFFSKSEG